MKKALSIYNETNKKLKALGYAEYLIGWDSQTEAPVKANHLDEMAVLSEMSYKLATDEKYTEAIETLYKHINRLNKVMRHEISEAKRSADQLKKIPMEEYIAFGTLTNEFYNVYVKAKNENNFALALPYYEKIVEYRKKYVKWLETDELKGYDVLLDDFERGMTAKKYDEFFALLKQKLVPLIKKINNAPEIVNQDFAKKRYSKKGQQRFQEHLRKLFLFNKNYTVIKESEHPFTTNDGITDVRITNHFYEDNFASSIYSAIHEMGHGLYELQISPEIDKTMSGGGASMAMHESQSRFMENLIGRHEKFWNANFAKLKNIFKSNLKDVTAEDMYKYVNRVECSLIRTEADELTYSLHVLVRYEMERGLLAGEIQAKDIPAKWNELYKEYLGVDVPSDKEGCLQDVHWAYGEFGYFPTYSLGSAYASQIYHAMQKEVNIDECIEKGNLRPIAKWLKTHVHQYGSSMHSTEILKLATGEDFNPNYYVDYLVEKYSKLYNV